MQTATRVQRTGLGNQMDLGDLFEGLGTTRPLGRRGQLVARLIVGFALAVLSFVGAYHIAVAEAGIVFKTAGVLMFSVLGLFGVFGIGLGVGGRVLGCLFVASFFGLFAARIAFGP